MPFALNCMLSPSAKRMVATVIEAGWDVSVTHGEGIVVRKGRVLIDVPWVRMRATRRIGRKRKVNVTVKELDLRRAELFAATHLLKVLERPKTKSRVY